MDEQNNVNMGSAPSNSSAGLIIGIIIILVIIILGGLYFWKQNAVDEEIRANETVESINTQSESDDTSSIEADLNSTDVDYVDAELNAS